MPNFQKVFDLLYEREGCGVSGQIKIYVIGVKDGRDSCRAVVRMDEGRNRVNLFMGRTIVEDRFTDCDSMRIIFRCYERIAVEVSGKKGVFNASLRLDGEPILYEDGYNGFKNAYLALVKFLRMIENPSAAATCRQPEPWDAE